MASAANAAQAKPLAIPADIAQFTTHLPSIMDMKKAKDEFAFDDAMLMHQFFLIVSAPPKVGKTHFACTISDLMPTYLLDSEEKGNEVVSKFVNVSRPDGKPRELFYKRVRSFVEMVASVRYITAPNPEGRKACKKGCIIIDSGSDLQTFAEELYLLEAGKEKVGLPRDWVNVFSRCNALLTDIRKSGWNLILTTRMKDEWKKNEATGKSVPRIWENAFYLSDAAIEWDGKTPWVKLNGLSKQEDPIQMSATTIGELLAQLRRPAQLISGSLEAKAA